ncbi:hypothetical protein FACS1894187_09810 [Synergistales bacterium]|nr:hypothetical protein FACS1894187_09810 [Synergistales bacterium]
MHGQIGKYKILDLLGEGGMGTVYLGQHDMLGRLDAIKVMRREFSDNAEFRKRFRREAKATALLRHPHIIQIHDMDVHRGDDGEEEFYYISMDFVSPDGERGHSLQDVINDLGENLLDPARIEKFFAQLCGALAHAHSNGVLHCDIKPANILLDYEDNVKLSDFGLVKTIDTTLFKSSIGAGDTYLGDANRIKSVEGSFLYMPPEVQEGKEWTKAGDVYSLGVVAYQLLTGRRPVGRWRNPCELVEGLPSWWDTLLEKCLEGETKDRYASGEDLLTAYDGRFADTEKERPAKEQAKTAERERLEKERAAEAKKQRIERERVSVFANTKSKIKKGSEIVISAGNYHTVGLKSDGTVVAVGNNNNKQCDVSEWRDIVAISARYSYTIGLKSDGTVVTASGSDYYKRSNASEWRDIVAVSAGGDHTIGLKSDGTVVAVGDNEYQQCGVSYWRDIVAVSAGSLHTIGLKSDGTVVAVGSKYCELRNVSEWRDIVAVSAGAVHTIGLKSDGTVVAVGCNNDGQCDVSEWRDIVAVSAGHSYTIGLKSDGTVVAVGDNDYKQCNVSEWRDIVAISAGVHHTVGLKSDGTVVAVGYNEDGQCNVSKWRDIKVY